MPQFTSRWSIPFLTIIERPSIHGITGQIAAATETALNTVQSAVDAARTSGDNARVVADQALSVPTVKAYVNAPILTASGSRGSVSLTNTVIRYPSESRDPARPRVLLCTRAGVHTVGGGVGWDAVPSASGGSTGPRIAQIRINADGNPGGGTAVSVEKRVDPNGATYAPFLSLPPEQVRLNVGDRVELFVQHGQGSGVNVTEATFLELTFVRPL